jgi:hypothetical protein
VSSLDLRKKYKLEHVSDAYEPPDPHWFEGAKLVSLATTPVGRLATTFMIERFEVVREPGQDSP